jgi:lysophospholipase L1-like esterase
MKALPLRFVSLALVVASSAFAQEAVIDSMDAATFKFTKETGRIELVDGKNGKALQFSFPEPSTSVFAARNAKPTPHWDKAAGFSFWVKGDGASHFGGLQLIWNNDFAARYDCAFPIDKEWRKITVAWRDLVPVLPVAQALPLGVQGGNAPSKFSQIWFGKWWYWRDVAAQTYAVDDMRLEANIPLDTTDYRPKGAPLDRVMAKLKAHQPVTIVTMGDSLTDTRHWTNRQTNWPAMLQAKLKERFGSEVTIVNPAIGGTQLRQNLILMPLWLNKAPEPDLVTVCFGYNDWDAGMRGPLFRETHKDAAERIRRATHGKADVLLMTPARALTRWSEMAELGQATRDAAKAENAGLADLEAGFEAAGATDRARLFATDKVHLSADGQAVVANAVLDALTKAAP